MPKLKIPNTISDQTMASLRRRADKANPQLRNFTDSEAVRRRKQSRDQLKNSRWS